MKTIILDGRVGSNGTEIKTTKTGKPYARFSMANNTFSNGEEKTEWYDVMCYDPTFIEKRAQFCGKGTYLIVTGSIRTEVRIDDKNKVWINHYITATNIDTPRFNSKNETNETTVSSNEPLLSTFTGSTTTNIESKVKAIQIPESQVKTVQIPETKVTVQGSTFSVDPNDDDLPF